MAILHIITNLDQQLFLWLNTHAHTPWLDVFFVILTNKHNWLGPGIIALVVLIVYEKERSLVFLFMLLFAVVISDQVSSGMLKPWVGRLRPCKTLEGFRLLIPCGGWWSFPSAHAANAAAMATLLGWRYPSGKWVWVLVALLIGYSRIYVGVHYPLDVLGGWVLGILSALAVIKGTMFLQNRFSGVLPQKSPTKPEG